jgi:expansin (peptidoglycan-binding protein)
MINCDPTSQCHEPLTATVKHGGKQIKVEIVDRCVGCKEGDIDLTIAAFSALADTALGRTSVQWQFN